MSNIIDDENVVSKERMLLAICLIMTQEHEHIDLEELINATGMTFQEARQAMHNLSMLKLIEVEPSFRGIPSFKIINKDETAKYLKLMGF